MASYVCSVENVHIDENKVMTSREYGAVHVLEAPVGDKFGLGHTLQEGVNLLLSMKDGRIQYAVISAGITGLNATDVAALQSRLHD